jgi:branched-chain amino acid transport system substrate-binding protein
MLIDVGHLIGKPRAIASRRTVAMGALGLLAATALTPRTALAADPIEVGTAAALTGYLAQYDGEFLNGLKLAAKVVNESGGVDGHMINLHILDNASNATTGVTVTNQLINQYNVSVMLNGASSAVSLAIHPIVAEAKVPFVTLSQLPPEHNWAFLSTTSFARVMDLELKFTTQYLKVKKIGILYNQTPAAQSATKTLQALAPKFGLEVVTTQGVEVTATDFTPQMAAFKEADPGAILDFVTGPAHILEAKGAATVGLKAALVMGLDDTPTFRQASTAYPNAFLSAIPAQVYPDILDPGMKAAVGAFLEQHKKAGLDPAGVQAAASGWDSVYELVGAVKASKATSGEALRKGFETLDYQGAVTHWRFTPEDHTGQLKSESLQTAKWENGAMKVVFRPQGD